MNTETTERNLSTADLLNATDEARARRSRTEPAANAPAETVEHDPANVERAANRGDGEQLAPLFVPDAAKRFREQWDAVQIGFVDDPRQAVQKADELVAQVMKSLAETFSSERTRLEAHADQRAGISTEDLRVALRHYRSFFERLLSL